MLLPRSTAPIFRRRSRDSPGACTEPGGEHTRHDSGGQPRDGLDRLKKTGGFPGLEIPLERGRPVLATRVDKSQKGTVEKFGCRRFDRAAC